MKNYKEKKVGSFNVKSGKVMVSDPCYKRGTWCQGILEGVKKGKWNAKILTSDEGGFGNRVAVLIVNHGDHNMAYSCSNWEQQDFEVGVDSGQAGIFDLDAYPHGISTGSYDSPTSWYRRICNLTLADHAGIIDNSGVASSSGYGDGGYDCKTITHKGKVVAIMIDYGLLQEEEVEEEVEEEIEE